MYLYRRPRIRQVPLQNMNHYRRRVPLLPLPSPCTTTSTTCRVRLSSLGFDKTTCTTTVAKYNYRTVTPSSSTKRVQLLPLRPTNTTTSLDDSNRSENARFEGITNETITHGSNALLYEMLAFPPCPSCRLRVPRFHATDMWDTR